MKHLLDPARPFLSNLSEAQRSLALERFRILRPFFEDRSPYQRWHTAPASRFEPRGTGLGIPPRRFGGTGSQDPPRSGSAKVFSTLQQFIEGLALQKPRPSVATIHRKVAETATNRGERVPSYIVVYRLIRKLEPALLTLAHEGTNSYSDRFDLVHRREAEAQRHLAGGSHAA